jgi:hypothetical protein
MSRALARLREAPRLAELMEQEVRGTMNSGGMQRQLRELRLQADGEPPHQVTIAAARRVVWRRAMEAVAGIAVLTAVISAAVPALGGVLGDTSTRAVRGPVERTPTAYVVNGISNTVTPIPPLPSSGVPRGWSCRWSCARPWRARHPGRPDFAAHLAGWRPQ